MYACSLCFYAYFPIFRITNPRHAPNEFSDHTAHWGSAILMAFHGFDVYRRPVSAFCEWDHADDPGVAPAEPCRMPDHPEIRPFAENWVQYPRVYPPGAMVFGALPAFLYALTSISFSNANLIMALQCVLAAHVASLLLLLCLWRGEGAAVGDRALMTSRQWNAGVLIFLVPTAHFMLACWGTFGNYDAASIVGLLAGVLLLLTARPAGALVALSAAMFTHFRALWYLPVLAVALHQTLNLPTSRKTVTALVTSALLLIPTAIAFLLLLPALNRFPLNNPSYFETLAHDHMEAVVNGLPVLPLIGVLLWNRSWLTASTALWQIFMLVQTRETRHWHALFLWPLVAIAARERRGAALALFAAVLLILVEARNVFESWPLSGVFVGSFLLGDPSTMK